MTEQSQIRCRGPRSCHSVDSVLSVQNKIFTRDGKKLIKILGTVASIESCTNRQLDGIWKTCEDLSWNHRTSTPHRSETNGIAERAVRRVKEGTSAVLLQSGPDERWWSDSVECYCYLRNVQDFLADEETPHERRFGEPFRGPIIPFGAMVEYHPISTRDQSRLHQFGKKVLRGISLGYELIAGGIWKGDLLAADLEDLEKLDASDIYPRRIEAKEVLKGSVAILKESIQLGCVSQDAYPTKSNLREPGMLGSKHAVKIL